MSSWLGRQRKPELVTLAERAGLDDFEGLRKEELVAVLDEHLQKNSSRLSTDATFSEYYGRASPGKRQFSGVSAVVTSDGEVKPKKKRAPKVKEEPEVSEGPSSPPPTITPAPARSTLAPSSMRTPSAATTIVKTFPPSPAVVTDAIDAQTRRLSVKVHETLAATHVENYLNDIRELFSSVVGIESVIFLLEGFYLQRQLVPWRRAFDIPPINAIGSDTQTVHLPDFFIILTDVYWSTTLLWSLISFWVPLVASWLFNLTMRPVIKAGVTYQKPRWRCDPLTFNVVKALLSWLVFAQRARFFGLFSDETAIAVQRSMPGGYAGILIGSSIGILASVYDAAQRK